MKNKNEDRIRSLLRFAAMVVVATGLLLALSGGMISEEALGTEVSAAHQAGVEDARDAWRSRRSNRASDRPPVQPSGFHSSLALKPQLSTLRIAADRGDAYAACILAWSLDLCGRRWNHERLLDYPDGYMIGLKDKQIERISSAVDFRERRVSSMCADIRPEDTIDIEERLLQSALGGHPESMARFATLPALPKKHIVYSATDFSSAHREHAEEMMNRAAEAGDLRAIVSISFAYSSGYINSAMGELPVKADPIKSMAATSARLWIRDNVEKEKLPAAYVDDGDDTAMRESLRARLARASQDELDLFTRLESKYVRAYMDAAEGEMASHNLLDDLPEQACASLRRTRAKARRGL